MRRTATGVLDARRASGPDVEPLGELRVRLVAVPAALLVAAVFSASQLGHALQRLFFGMPLHEIGHALTALLLGFPAFPLPWFTPISDGRSTSLTLLLLAVSATLVVHGRREERPVHVRAGITLGILVCAGRLLPHGAARALITFGGDAGALVLGAMLVATVFSGESSPLRRGGLRWGLLVVGAAAFCDVASSWLAARRDPGEIPFGQFEGGMLSDPSVLVQTYGWTETALVHRYLWLAALCLAALTALWVQRALRPALDARD